MSRTAITAAQFARREVDLMFKAMVEDGEVFIAAGDDHATCPFVRLGEAFTKVADLFAKERREPVDDSTSNVATELIGAYAGYLVGVQIGMRLRGGVR
jgi:hypothetical protein